MQTDLAGKAFYDTAMQKLQAGHDVPMSLVEIAVIHALNTKKPIHKLLDLARTSETLLTALAKLAFEAERYIIFQSLAKDISSINCVAEFLFEIASESKNSARAFNELGKLSLSAFADNGRALRRLIRKKEIQKVSQFLKSLQLHDHDYPKVIEILELSSMTRNLELVQAIIAEIDVFKIPEQIDAALSKINIALVSRKL